MKTKKNDKSLFYDETFAKNVYAAAPKYKYVIDVFRGIHPKVLLDIGCGDGDFAAVAKQELQLKKAIGIDIAPEAIKRAKKRGIEGYSLDLDEKDLPIVANSVDVVFCGEVIEHVYSSDHLLTELRRVVKPTGLVVITTPNLASWYNRLSVLFGYQPIFSDVSLTYSLGHMFPINTSFGHLRMYTLRGLVALMEAHNFSIVKTYGFGVNDQVGVGKKFGVITKIANWVFQNPAWSSDMCVIARKN